LISKQITYQLKTNKLNTNWNYYSFWTNDTKLKFLISIIKQGSGIQNTNWKIKYKIFSPFMKHQLKLCVGLK